MIIKILLIATLTVVILYAFSQRRRSPSVSTGALVLGLFGIICVLMPDITNHLANIMGVGRGADLLVYCFISIGLLAVLNIHLRLLQSHEALTEVARELAILRADMVESGAVRSPDQ